jgi:competence protein ComEC
MTLEKISIFSTKKEFFLFLSFCLFVVTYTLLIEYNNYKNLTKFDSSIVEATVLKQYTKTKTTKKGKIKEYQVLRLKTSSGLHFYTTAKKSLKNIKNKNIRLEIYAGKINFYEYMTSFYAFSKIRNIDETKTLKESLNNYIQTSHTNQNIANIYQALYTASPLSKELQLTFSQLGVSHLLAISGFHLGVLSALLFFLFKTPYKYFQNRYFPYRSYSVDSFVAIAFILLGYLLFLDAPPSLLRAYVMLVIGFVLYNRGFKIVSMWTLFITMILILSFSPRLIFSIGFWLSIFGVFYIFLFLIHFKYLHKLWQFILVPIWVYLMMLPYSLFIFENFSIYHPLSIIWTSLFTLFYPLSIVLHLVGFGDLLDESLLWLLELPTNDINIVLSLETTTAFLLLSLASLWRKTLAYLLALFALLIFNYAIYNVT